MSTTANQDPLRDFIIGLGNSASNRYRKLAQEAVKEQEAAALELVKKRLKEAVDTIDAAATKAAKKGLFQAETTMIPFTQAELDEMSINTNVNEILEKRFKEGLDSWLVAQEFNSRSIEMATDKNGVAGKGFIVKVSFEGYAIPAVSKTPFGSGFPSLSSTAFAEAPIQKSADAAVAAPRSPFD